MKKLITYIAFIICVVSNAQANKVIEATKSAREITDEWFLSVDSQLNDIKKLRQEINALKSEVSELKQQINNQDNSSNISEIVGLLDINIFTEDELPKNFNADEVGVAFVKKNNELSLAICINNQWKLFKL